MINIKKKSRRDYDMKHLSAMHTVRVTFVQLYCKHVCVLICIIKLLPSMVLGQNV